MRSLQRCPFSPNQVKSDSSLAYLLGEAVGDALGLLAGALSLLQAVSAVPKLTAKPKTKAKFINFLFIHSSHKLRHDELSAS